MSRFEVETDQSHSTGSQMSPPRLRRTSSEEDQDWNDDSDADWTIDFEGRSSLSGRSVCVCIGGV